MYRVCMHFLLVTMSFCDVLSQPAAYLHIEKRTYDEELGGDKEMTIFIPTKPIVSPLPSPDEFQFQDFILNELEKVEQSALQIFTSNDEIVQAEEYLMHGERRDVDSSEDLLSEQLEEENIKLKCFIKDLLRTIHIVSDANNILLFIICFLLVLTVTNRCHARSKQVNTASNTIPDEETIKV